MKKVAVAVLALALSMAFAAVAPVFAKDFNVPKNVANIIYLTSGEGVVEVPAGWPTGGTHPATLKIEATHVEDGFFGRDADYITISVPYGSIYLPVVYFTNNPNPDALSQVRTILSGMPASGTTNSKLLSDSELIVERHGNRITAELTTPQTVRWNKIGGGYIQLDIPKFTIELDKVGGSVHREAPHSFTGYPMASGYTNTEEEMGFNADGVFTCTGWNSQMSSCFIVMHGITTYFFPTPT